MLIRGHTGESYVRVDYDRSDGVEILAAQLGSLLSSEVLLVDFAGREINDDDDLNDVQVVESGESSESQSEVGFRLSDSLHGRPSFPLDDWVHSDTPLGDIPLEGVELIAPPSPPRSPPRSPSVNPSRRSSGSKVSVVSLSVADVWCVDVRLKIAGGAPLMCTAALPICLPEASEDESRLIQPRFRLVDTDILLCEHCQHLLDPSLVVDESAAPLASFVCQGQKAAAMGLLYPASESQPLPLLPTFADLQGPVGLFLKRQLLFRAIRRYDHYAPTFPSLSPTSSLQPLVSAFERDKAEKDMMQRLRSGMNTVWAYEDSEALSVARAVIDYPKVHEGALKYLQANERCAEDVAMVMGLLHWFKGPGGFFQWVTKPACDHASCPSKLPQTDPGWVTSGMEARGVVAPSVHEAEVGGAGRTELYHCSACNGITRFPRFTRPAHLLSWRKGRCGEFANAFCFVCRALSLDARWVLDWTDHVWVEVWIPSEGRYVHADPCERALDQPLLYESGWGKKLTYVVSFSRHGAVDSTSRYTRKLAEVLERRGASGVSERFLSESLLTIDRELEERFFSTTRGMARAASTSSLRLDMLDHGAASFETMAGSGISTVLSIQRRKRLLSKELLGLMLEVRHCTKMSELQGRISGDREWKEARGETGSAAAAAAPASCDADVAVAAALQIFSPPPQAPEWARDRLRYVRLGGGEHGDTVPFDLCADLWPML